MGLLAEISLQLKKYDVLAQHIQILDDAESGVFSKVNYDTRKYFKSSPRLQFATELHLRGMHIWEWMTGTHLEMEGLLDVPPGAEVLRDSSSNAGSIALTTQRKRHGLQTTRTTNQVPVENSWVEILGSGSSASSNALDRQVTA